MWFDLVPSCRRFVTPRDYDVRHGVGGVGYALLPGRSTFRRTLGWSACTVVQVHRRGGRPGHPVAAGDNRGTRRRREPAESAQPAQPCMVVPEDDLGGGCGGGVLYYITAAPIARSIGAAVAFFCLPLSALWLPGFLVSSSLSLGKQSVNVVALVSDGELSSIGGKMCGGGCHWEGASLGLAVGGRGWVLCPA